MLFLSLIVFDFSLLPHGSMKLQGQASYGGCRADIQACHVTGKISAGACGCDLGSAAGHEGWRNSPQP